MRDHQRSLTDPWNYPSSSIPHVKTLWPWHAAPRPKCWEKQWISWEPTVGFEQFSEQLAFCWMARDIRLGLVGIECWMVGYGNRGTDVARVG